MHWGIEFDGDGWYTLLDALCASLSTESWSGTISTQEDGGDEMWSYELPQVVFDQVKTKFAGLRAYYHIETSPAFEAMAVRFPKTAVKLRGRLEGYIDGAIQMAESMAQRTCEVTGRPGQMCSYGGNRGGWLKTLCPEEAAKQGYAPLRAAAPEESDPDQVDPDGQADQT